ncbi:hypothetical protein [Rubritalea tangerina]|uniref:hypothetical protein n=1 Tax=Rubritalea tangerina TaxID=430798 RepID=UPI00360FFFAF
MTDDKRWVLAGFAALLGSLLIIFGFRKYRVVGVILALLLAAGVCSMPLLYPEQLSPGSEGDIQINVESTEGEQEDAELALERYKLGIGYDSIESKIADAQSPEDVLAITLIRSKPAHTDTIIKYLASALKSDELPRVYKNRKVNEVPATVVLYLEASVDIDQAAEALKRVGAVAKVHRELRVIDVYVDLESMKVADSDALLDEAHPNFYRLNLKELKHIDPKRQHDAVLRLAKVSKLSLRSDIANQLLVLSENVSDEHWEDLMGAMTVWSVEGDGAADIILKRARELALNQKTVSRGYVDFIIGQKVREGGDVVLYAWMRDPVGMEAELVEAGPMVEEILIEMMPELEPIQLQSAANALRKFGSKAALPALLTAYESSSGDVKKSLKATIDEIESRE